MNDLVTRLRGFKPAHSVNNQFNMDRLEAADRIEALESALALAAEFVEYSRDYRMGKPAYEKAVVTIRAVLNPHTTAPASTSE